MQAPWVSRVARILVRPCTRSEAEKQKSAALETIGNSFCACAIRRVDLNGGSSGKGIRWIDDDLVGWIEAGDDLDRRSIVTSDGDWNQLSLVIAHHSDA